MEQKDIISFATNAYEAFPTDTKKADLLIREFMRNYEKLAKSKNISDIQITRQKWLKLTWIFFILAVIFWCIFLVTDASKDKVFSLIGLGALFFMVVSFSIICFMRFIKDEK